METQTGYWQYLVTTSGKQSKFKVGDKVVYLPTLSGLRENECLMVRSIYFKESDELSTSFGIDYIPTFVYKFENINSEEFSLSAQESDIDFHINKKK
jgi:hypothetical protein